MQGAFELRREASAVVMRDYRESGSTCDSCAQAVRLLLNFGDSKQKGRSASDPDDVEESKKIAAPAPGES